MNTDDKPISGSDLRWLPPPRAAVFALACVRRMAPSYAAFVRESGWGDEAAFVAALAVAAQLVAATDDVRARAVGTLAILEKLAPDSDDFGDIGASAAQDAVFATCQLFDFFVSGDAEHLVSAASYPFESLDRYIQEVDSMTERGQALNERIEDHPLFRRERVRQRRDFEALALTDGIDEVLGRSFEQLFS